MPDGTYLAIIGTNADVSSDEFLAPEQEVHIHFIRNKCS